MTPAAQYAVSDRRHNRSPSFNECLKEVEDILNNPRRLRLLSSLIGFRTKQRLFETAKNMHMSIPKHAVTVMANAECGGPSPPNTRTRVCGKRKLAQASTPTQLPIRKRLRSMCEGDTADTGRTCADTPELCAQPTSSHVPSTISHTRATRSSTANKLTHTVDHMIVNSKCATPVSSRLRRRKNTNAALVHTNPIDAVETPTFREVRVGALHSMEGIEDTSDSVYHCRHLRRENEEKKMVKQDRLRQKEAELRYKLEQSPGYAIYLPRHNSLQHTVDKPCDTLHVNDIRIQVCPKIPSKATTRKNVCFG